VNDYYYYYYYFVCLEHEPTLEMSPSYFSLSHNRSKGGVYIKKPFVGDFVGRILDMERTMWYHFVEIGDLFG
jgi:hypothetical protein